ncbi:MAG: DUF2293 domain-containing protein [Lentisphaerae bacterium]|nr:DUF2293 domain-containing protein [Lentisphaerota bacterium]MBT5612691.1 DUF2293 domain-containing protein [Lentisphaerota bacterium]MBT7057565.1 DUF2293 domain-containing protein [Lentisphaerota bacterium]MBT7846160.1 DUF2293 domain-containing protein [Lentisphaerota bacterium]
MTHEVRTVTPGPKLGTVRAQDGTVLQPPEDWELVPPGDAALTRRIKQDGPTWTVQEKHGRRVFSQGVWAPKHVVVRVRKALGKQRATPEYARKKEADRRRRDRDEKEYQGEFEEAVRIFLRFHTNHDALEKRLAQAVAAHATPVGSGTVARTRRISVEDRAEAAVIAWLRHQTTLYDRMDIPRVKGKRREVRRALARGSRELLSAYRRPEPIPSPCPLAQALDRAAQEGGTPGPEAPSKRTYPKRLPPGFDGDFFLSALVIAFTLANG